MNNALDVLTSWTEALLAERTEERSKLASSLAESSLKQRRAEGMSWSPVEVTDASFAFGGAKWNVICGEGGGIPGAFRVGSAVLLTPVGEDEAVKDFGRWPARVRSIRGLQMELILEGEGPEGVAIQHVRWTVDARADERSYQAMAHALSHWVNVEDPERIQWRDQWLGLASSWSAPSSEDAISASFPTLNVQQEEAAHNILSRPKVSLIHGPPGTGKTRTLVSAIASLAIAGDKVLASGPSNMSVDVLVERLAAQGLNVVRVGHPMRVQPEVLSRTLDARVQDQSEFSRVVKTRKEADQKRRDAEKFVRNFGPEQREARRRARAEARTLRKEAEELEGYLADRVLREADVVCATLVGCDDRRLRALNFDVAVVDEAAQALPPATLIPMRRAQRVVLCGDPCQLPPVVKSKGGSPLATTMLERLMKDVPQHAYMLEVQHRMHPAIMSAGNAHFYHGRLKAHPSVAEATLEGIPPMLWVDTSGCGFEEKRSEEGGSVSNEDEARFVLDRAKDWLALHSNMTLGVVAPYAAQVECLRVLWQERVRDGELPSDARVTIHTVDGFQGQERDGMLISLTRSNERGEVGFLSESRRIHVAQTRAKHACMLVGDSATLSQDPYLGWLVEFAQSQGAYDSAWSWMV